MPSSKSSSALSSDKSPDSSCATICSNEANEDSKLCSGSLFLAIIIPPDLCLNLSDIRLPHLQNAALISAQASPGPPAEPDCQPHPSPTHIRVPAQKVARAR